MALNADRSQQVADRRRRLIAAEEDLPSGGILAEYGILPIDGSGPEPPISQSGDRIVRRLISRRLWKHVVVISVMSLLAAISMTAEGLTAQLPASLPVEQLQRALAGIELFLCGQLAILIGWLRCRSQVDYRGRYRSWRWYGIALMGTACVSLAGLQTVLPDFLTALIEPLTGDISAAKPALTVVVSCGVMAFLLSRIIPDTGRNRITQGLILLATLPAVLYVMKVATPQADLLPQVTELHLLLATSHILFTAVVLHARFVAWVSNDPPIGKIRDRSQSQPKSEDGELSDARSAPAGPQEMDESSAGEGDSGSQGVTDKEDADQNVLATNSDVASESHPAELEDPGPAKKKSRTTRRRKKYRKAG